MRASELPHITTDLLTRVRERAPRVHCITNAVAQTFTANVLLAAGAIPSMTLSADEIGAFVARADALLVNLGTFDAERRDATATALEVASEDGAAVGARSGLHRPLRAARRVCENARDAEAARDPTQPWGVHRAERPGAGRRRADPLRARYARGAWR